MLCMTFDSDCSDWEYRKAIYDRPGPPGSEGGFMQKETGRAAWLLWRSAYFTMTLSWRNKSVSIVISCFDLY